MNATVKACIVIAFVALAGGCGAALALGDTDDQAHLAECRKAGRDAEADAGGDAGAGWSAYVACKNRYGLGGAQ